MGLVRLLPRSLKSSDASAQAGEERSPVSEPRPAFDPAALLSGTAEETPAPVGTPTAAETPAVEPVAVEPVPVEPLADAPLAEPPLASVVADPPAAPAEPTPVLSPVVLPDASTRAPQRAATKVIALANQKGGVAKTTTTLNLGVALTELGRRVLLIDLDPQGNLTMSQGMNPDVIERSMFDVLVHRVPISEIVAHAELDIAVASIDLAGAELALSALIGRERALDKALAEVRGQYDYILIDTPPSLGLLTINAFVAATGVIVPVQCEYLSLRGLVQLENTLAMVRENLNPHVKVEGIVPTMYDGRTLHAREAIEILEENFGELVFQTRIRKTVRYAEAPVKGSSVLKYDPTGSAAEAYRALARELVAKEESHGAQAREHA